MNLNRPAIAEKCAGIARYLDLPAPSYEALFQWTVELRTALDIPATLSGLIGDDAQFEQLARMAVVDPTAKGNPVELTEENCRELYRRSFAGLH